MARWLVLPVCLFLVLSGCSRSRQDGSDPVEVPGDLTIVFGEGGGITGLWQGHTIRPDGKVLAWQGRVAGEDPREAGELPSADLAALWGRIRAGDFFAQQHDQRGDLTRFIRVTASGETHEVRWLPQIGAPIDSLHPADLYRRCRAAIARLEK